MTVKVNSKAIKAKDHKVEYNPTAVEQKWQMAWKESGIFSPNLDNLINTRTPYYNLMMFPYPSGEGLHVGNMHAFTGSDIWGRYQRMKGFEVFEPIGLDGFGIHSENYAIKTGEHPAKLAKVTEKRFYAQLEATGNSYDWKRTLETYDTDYYRWTQWLFVQMFKHGLTYRKKSKVNWCPSCKTVLADEQVISGECERCSTSVEFRDLEQWFFKITEYADQMLANLTKLDWTEKVKIAQRNWIGKKEGMEIEYKISRPDPPLAEEFSIKVFTTRPDTNFGATFIVLAPEHPLTLKIASKERYQTVQDYITTSQNKSADERKMEGRKKTGAFTGAYAINNLNGARMPIWVSDFVLTDFGTGAVVGVPGHDIRDFEFAKEFGLPIVRVVAGKDGDTSEITDSKQVQEEEGKMVNSEFLNGLEIGQAKEKIMDYLEEKSWGVRKVTYHLRDWLISRQRYWGPPIPMIYCLKCAQEGKSWFTTSEAEEIRNRKHEILKNSNDQNGLEFRNSNFGFSGAAGWYPVPEDQLPVELPFIENYQPRGTGESPLTQDQEWIKVICPECGFQARRETDVSDTFLDSSWYFLRYLATDSNEAPFPSKKFSDENLKFKIENSFAKRKGWLPVSMYIGGAEHAVLHLMYVRFVTMALHDWGYLDFDEPMPRFYAHGLLIKDGAKMSKSKGNVVVPDEYIKKFGADTLRTYLMFLGPFDQSGDFRDTGIEGMSRFAKRVWELVVSDSDGDRKKKRTLNETLPLSRITHKTIKRVTEDMEGLRYNRAIAGIMEYVNFLRETTKEGKTKGGGWGEAIKTLVFLLAPFMPHMTEELWQMLEDKTAQVSQEEQAADTSLSSVHFQPWPTYDPELVKEEIISVPVQVNGKLRAILKIGADNAQDQAVVESGAKGVESVNKYLTGEEIKKVVFIPSRLINFVTSKNH